MLVLPRMSASPIGALRTNHTSAGPSRAPQHMRSVRTAELRRIARAGRGKHTCIILLTYIHDGSSAHLFPIRVRSSDGWLQIVVSNLDITIVRQGFHVELLPLILAENVFLPKGRRERLILDF